MLWLEGGSALGPLRLLATSCAVCIPIHLPPHVLYDKHTRDLDVQPQQSCKSLQHAQLQYKLWGLILRIMSYFLTYIAKSLSKACCLQVIESKVTHKTAMRIYVRTVFKGSVCLLV
jgi:hypothetical protein